MEQLQKEFVHYKDTHVSVMELSHRSKDYDLIHNHAINIVKKLMNVPSNYKVLLLQGGGNGQFAGVPLNLLKDKKKADYIVTGCWSAKAAKEAQKYCEVNMVLPKTTSYIGIAPTDSLSYSQDAAYVYFCTNETIDGVEFMLPEGVPEGVPLVCDMSSNFFSRPVDVTKYGMIFGGAQKNIGCAGVAVAIIREDLLGHTSPLCPIILDYTLMSKNNSIYNTPPTFPIHVLGQVLSWVDDKGGLEAMEKAAKEKSSIIYDVIDKSNGFYCNPVLKDYRSRMNVVFRIGSPTGDENLEQKFVSEGAKQGLLSLKGHKFVGGIRVSLYNALSVSDALRLKQFMIEFNETENKNKV